MMIRNIKIDSPVGKHLTAVMGFCSAVLATALTFAFILMAVIFPSAEWNGLDAYASTFNSRQMAQFIPLILLAPTVVFLMACIHSITAETKKVFSLVGVAISSVYAAIICANYYLQIYVVRLSLLNGDLEGLYLMAMPNPRSIFVGLETVGYAFLSLSMLSASQVFEGGKLENWIRGIFIFSSVMGIFSAVIAPFDQPVLFYSGFGLSLLAFPVATLLVSIYFKHLGAGAGHSKQG
jgi:hypothetical protein